MSHFELFERRDPVKRRQHIRNLLAVALRQGPLEPGDNALLFKAGIRAGIGPMELDGILRMGRTAPFVKPASPRACLEQLYDVVLTLMFGGHLNPNELNLCKAIAQRLGFPKPAVESLIGQMYYSIAKGQPAEQTIGKLMA